MGSKHGNYTGQEQPARQSVLANPNRGSNRFLKPLAWAVGTVSVGIVIAGVNYLNEDSKNKAFGPVAVANEHTAGVDGGKITLQPKANVRANPVTNDGNIVCTVPIGQPVEIETREVTLANGVATNPNDANGPWVMVDLNNLPDPLKSSCADGVQHDQDGKGWVSVEGGKIDVHLK